MSITVPKELGAYDDPERSAVGVHEFRVPRGIFFTRIDPVAIRATILLAFSLSCGI
jgi:hypothetical protein